MERTTLVTGATSGIGRAICVELLSEGSRVVGVGRDFSKFPTDDGNFTPVKLDLGNLDRLPKRLKKLVAEYENIDALVLNAGQGLFGDLEQFSYEQIRESIDLNFLSAVYLTRAYLPSMKKRGRGDIVIMGSEAALGGKQKATIYAAGKAALRSFAQSLRAEVASSGIRVTIINPGMVNTAFFDGLDFAPGVDESNYIDPHDVAGVVSMVLKMRRGTVLDEVNLSPQKRVINFRKSGRNKHS